MYRYRMSAAAGVACALLAASTPVTAQTALTLEDVARLARERAPSVLAERARLGEAEARIAGAALRFHDNPRVSIDAGPRSRGYVDFEAGIEQQFDPRGARPARMASAHAALDGDAARAEVFIRSVVRDAAAAFVRVLYYDRTIGTLDTSRSVSADMLAAAERRYSLGDVAVLDVNIARATAARAEAAQRSATAGRAEAAADLAALLGVSPTGLVVAGDLVPRPLPPIEELRVAAMTRPDLRALEAERGQAEADGQVAEAQRRVRLGGTSRYKREGGDQIVLGGLTITLPVFNAGQELQLAAAARARRATLELDAVRAAILARVEGAAAAAAAQAAALRALDEGALSQLEENETLARRSYDAGQISLADWLILRRELLDTRLEYLDRLRDAALTRLDVDALTGALR